MVVDADGSVDTEPPRGRGSIDRDHGESGDDRRGHGGCDGGGHRGHEGDEHGTLEPESSGLSWPDSWSNQRGPKLDISLLQAGHVSFSDLRILVAQVDEAFDLPAEAVERVEDLIGTIDPDRSIAAQRAYIAAFLDLHVRQRGTHLLDGPSPALPEVRFIP